MNKIIIILSFILTMFLTMCNCSLIPSNSQGTINVDIAWRAQVGVTANFSILVHGNTAYVTVGGGLTAVNLDNGSIKWKVEGQFVPNSNPVMISNTLYLFEFYSSESEINNVRIARIAVDGSRVEMLNVGPDESWNIRIYYLSSDETYLYWGTRSFNVGEGTNKLVKLNPATMEKEIIFTTTNEFVGKILIESNIAYVGHIPQDGTSDSSIFGTITAINLSNNSILWEKTPKSANYMKAFPLIINNDRLYVFDGKGTACYNQYTGQEIFDNSNSFGGYYGGGVFDGDYAYFTSPRYGKPKVYCINKDTGAVVWSADNEQLGSTPHINKGILYVAGPNQLCLYNATNGKLIGTDPRIKGQMFQMSPTERYGDLMIICGSEGMVSVRMNYKL